MSKPKTPAERATEAYGVADRRVIRAQARADKTKAELDAATAELEQAKALLDYAKLNPALPEDQPLPEDES